MFFQLYLQRYGYLNESMNNAKLIPESVYENAIKDFQRFAGINETGKLDEETVTMMNAPRCGNKDIVGHGEEARRRKRYALQGSKWRKTGITYHISKYSTKFDEATIDREVGKAFQVWSEVTPLNFVPTKGDRVNIDIQFVKREHGDGDPFDGPGNTLAHAYFPQYGGDAHFDDEERWTLDSYFGTNLFQVAAHELGHSLGLGHSSIRDSLMAPFYQRYKPNFKLHKDDVLGIQALYGKRKEPMVTTTTTSTERPTEKPRTYKPFTTKKPIDSDVSGEAPDLCQEPKMDAVTRISNGNTYVFKGDYYWKVETNGLADGYPRRISSDWDGLPGNLNAALTWADGKTFFFKGNNYWRFHDMKMDPGYPKEMEVGFAGIPANIDAAFVWSGNGKTYFFKDKEYWRFDSKSDPPVSSRYPKPIKNWVGLPNNIDAAFKWENGSEYFRFNDVDFEVDTKAKPPFPRQTSVWWYDCKSANSANKRAGLVAHRKKPIYIGMMHNTMDDIKVSASSSDVLQVDKNENEWVKHGSVDDDSSSAISCKTNIYLILIGIIIISVINTKFHCAA
ncbi:Matrix metalloproteinase-14-like protein [Leptotrombidium deliense]|uniref:Matrix metalloproteinase-14-like protein n=1 Tax=Leptotrombidium deliense TaxID=299467 RepID=A0A443SS29_9ACAR|nr:Matrix metalloproteinase-14-like protein [Leptotrombidium deliense]